MYLASTQRRGGVEGVGESSVGWEASGVRGMLNFFWHRRQTDDPKVTVAPKNCPLFGFFSCERLLLSERMHHKLQF